MAAARKRLEANAAFFISHHAYIYAALLSRSPSVMQLIVDRMGCPGEALLRPISIHGLSEEQQQAKVDILAHVHKEISPDDADVPMLVHAMVCCTPPEVLRIAFEGSVRHEGKVNWADPATMFPVSHMSHDGSLIEFARRAPAYQAEYMHLMLEYGMQVKREGALTVLLSDYAPFLENKGALLVQAFKAIEGIDERMQTIKSTVIVAYDTLREDKYRRGPRTGKNYMFMTQIIIRHMDVIVANHKRCKLFIGKLIETHPAEVFSKCGGRINMESVNIIAGAKKCDESLFTGQLTHLACDTGFTFGNEEAFAHNTVMMALCVICSNRDEELLGKLLKNMSSKQLSLTAIMTFLQTCKTVPHFMIRGLSKFLERFETFYPEVIQILMSAMAAHKGSSKRTPHAAVAVAYIRGG